MGREWWNNTSVPTFKALVLADNPLLFVLRLPWILRFVLMAKKSGTKKKGSPAVWHTVQYILYSQSFSIYKLVKHQWCLSGFIFICHLSFSISISVSLHVFLASSFRLSFNGCLWLLREVDIIGQVMLLYWLIILQSEDGRIKMWHGDLKGASFRLPLDKTTQSLKRKGD